MSKQKQPKTVGLTWLGHSMNSFNGSGYADRTSARAFVESYREYKNLRHKPEAVVLVDQNYKFALDVAGVVVGPSMGANVAPVKKSIRTFCPHCGASIRIVAE